MKKNHVWLAAAALALALTGCAGEGETSAAGSPEPSAEPTPSATAESASISDWHPVAAKQLAGVEAWITEWKTGNCDKLYDGQGQDASCPTVGARAGEVAAAVEAGFLAAQEEGSPSFVGEVPVDLETSLESVLESVEAAEAAAVDWTAECPGDLCSNRTLLLTMAMSGLEGQLGSWVKVYT